jgi:hypothetical protein
MVQSVLDEQHKSKIRELTEQENKDLAVAVIADSAQDILPFGPQHLKAIAHLEKQYQLASWVYAVLDNEGYSFTRGFIIYLLSLAAGSFSRTAMLTYAILFTFQNNKKHLRVDELAEVFPKGVPNEQAYQDVWAVSGPNYTNPQLWLSVRCKVDQPVEDLPANPL